MKIGILTQPLKSNYGCVLQNYALHTILKRMGHEPVTVRTRQLDFGIHLRKWIVQRCKYIAGTLLPSLKSKSPQSWKEIGLEYSTDVTFQTFIDKYIATTEPLFGVSSKKISKYGFDAYVVGSDQVWKPAFNGSGLIYNMYLDFAEKFGNVRRVAYAASFGVDEWEYKHDMTVRCRGLVSKFDAVSVREESAIRLCKEHLGIDALHCIDPTMLLGAGDYCSIVREEDRPQGQILIYVLDMNERKRALIGELCRIMGKKAFYIGELAVEKGESLPSLESWLAGFDVAEYVITDSFHGSAFSLIFNKPFVSLGNSARGLSRFESLLSMFGQTHRLWVSEEYDAVKIKDILEVETDWAETNKVLEEERGKAFLFLKEALG